MTSLQTETILLPLGQFEKHHRVNNPLMALNHAECKAGFGVGGEGGPQQMLLLLL